MLDDYLLRAARYHIPELPLGEFENVEDMYDALVHMTELPCPRVVGWWEMLQQYVAQDNAVVFARKLERGQRRGFENLFHNGFSYVFSDNALACSIYAMVAACETIPTCEEFTEHILNHRRMPLMFIPNGEERSLMCAFPFARHPLLRGWKLAHILDVNADYSCDYDAFQSRYFTPGCLRDWRVVNGYGPVRRMGELPDADRSVFVAHFLRFMNPMNYFLVPNDRHHRIYVNGNRFGQGVGEYEPMKQFVRTIRSEQYGNDFDTFEDIAMYLPPLVPADENIRVRIDVCPMYRRGAESTAVARPEGDDRDEGNGDTQIVLNPANPDEFKRCLLASRQADRRLVFADGRVQEGLWNARRFLGSSDLFKNIKTSKYWQIRRATGLIRVELTVRE